MSMNFDFIPNRFDIKVGDKFGGYLIEEEDRDWDGDKGYINVWKLWSYNWDELGTFNTLEEAKANISILEEYLSTDECWLER